MIEIEMSKRSEELLKKLILESENKELRLVPGKEIAMLLPFAGHDVQHLFDFEWRSLSPVVLTDKSSIELRFLFSVDKALIKRDLIKRARSPSPAMKAAKSTSRAMRASGWAPAYNEAKVAAAETQLAHALADLVGAFGGDRPTVDPSDPSAAVNHVTTKLYMQSKSQAKEILMLKEQNELMERQLGAIHYITPYRSALGKDMVDTMKLCLKHLGDTTKSEKLLREKIERQIAIATNAPALKGTDSPILSQAHVVLDPGEWIMGGPPEDLRVPGEDQSMELGKIVDPGKPEDSWPEDPWPPNIKEQYNTAKMFDKVQELRALFGSALYYEKNLKRIYELLDKMEEEIKTIIKDSE